MEHPDFENHIQQLESLILSTGEQFEGNCMYGHMTFTRFDELAPKQRNLVRASQHGDKIMEIGFNGGHSALLFLLGNPNCSLHLFDMGEHQYSQLCYDYLNNVFPDRLSITWGNSCQTIPRFIVEHLGTTFDVIHVDGGHHEGVCRSDLEYSRLLSHSDTWVIIDDTRLPGVHKTFTEMRVNMLEPVYQVFEQTLMYPHRLCKYRKAHYAICSLTIGDTFKDICMYSTLTKVHYCAKYGIDLLMDESVYDESRPPAWSKIRLMQKYLPEYEVILWLDSDLYLMNMDIPLSEQIERYLIDYDMFVGTDWKMLNTGVWFVRNTVYSSAVLERIYRNFIDHGNWEQEAFITMYNADDMCMKSHVRVDYHVDINSYWYNFHWGHFILHLCGCRQPEMLRHAMYKYCPVKRWDEAEDAFRARLSWIETQNGSNSN